jgi:phosphotransferase system enzyme I (PtsI)
MSETRLSGVAVSPGRAGGPVVRVAEPLGEPSRGPAPADTGAEAARIAPAARTVAARLEALAATATGDVAEILTTTAMMATDPALVGEAERLVVAEHLPAPRAVYESAGSFTRTLAAAGGYLAERVRDIEDVRDRIVAELLGAAPPGVPDLSTPSVLIARDLAPADTTGLDPAKVLALATEQGGPISHTAILARALGIPAVVAVIGAAARDSGKPSGVCGEAAADPRLARVLAGLGMTSLSMNAPAIQGVGSSLAAVTLAECATAAKAALSGMSRDSST